MREGHVEVLALSDTKSCLQQLRDNPQWQSEFEPTSRFFVRCLSALLETSFDVIIASRTGFVKISQGNLANLLNVASAGVNTIPVIGALLQLIPKTMGHLWERERKKVSEKLANYLITADFKNEMRLVCNTVAYRIAKSFEQQLQQLTLEGALILSEVCAKQIFQQLLKRKNQERLVISNNGNDITASLFIRELYSFTFLPEPSKLAEPRLKKTHLPTQDERLYFTSDGLLAKTGLSYKDVNDSFHFFTNERTRALKYGYRNLVESDLEFILHRYPELGFEKADRHKMGLKYEEKNYSGSEEKDIARYGYTSSLSEEEVLFLKNPPFPLPQALEKATSRNKTYRRLAELTRGKSSFGELTLTDIEENNSAKMQLLQQLIDEYNEIVEKCISRQENIRLLFTQEDLKNAIDLEAYQPLLRSTYLPWHMAELIQQIAEQTGSKHEETSALLPAAIHFLEKEIHKKKKRLLT